MSKKGNPYAALNRLFHEPNRLAILSALCNTTNGITFNELKHECALTDGNLSRHLRSLQHARIIRIRKSFVKSKPLTTIYLTERGRDSFIRYLEALEEVLLKAAESIGAEKSSLPLPLQKPAKA